MQLVLRGATVVDGTGAPGAVADVGVDRGRIVEVGTIPAAAAEHAVDLAGLVLAPGFIDVHTHYDAQILWDRDLTPSSWHGVTTVVLGNCGFGIAPTRLDHRHLIMLLLENVEGMPLAALEQGIRWSFETYPEYLAELAGAPTRLNVLSLIGHTPLRFYVMGDDATERSATPAEIEVMCRLLAEALDAGAAGFATSRSQGAVGAYGKPVPSRAADLEEIWALADVLRRKERGTFVAASGPDLTMDVLSEIGRRTGRPVTWGAIMAARRDRAKVHDAVARLDELDDEDVYPQIACRPIVIQMTLADPDAFANIPGFAEALTLDRPARAALYADPGWRARTLVELLDRRGHVLDGATVDETEVHAHLVGGPTLAELAAVRGGSPLDVMIELALAEDLRTRFRFVLNNDDEETLAELLRNPRVLLGLSDAGAHASQLCDSNFTTHLLGHWCRERRAIGLEQAVWRLSGQPARAFGLTDRGRVGVGAAADLVAFDPATVGSGPPERVHDQPGGADRLVARSRGVEHVWVGGQAIVVHGAVVEGSRPGRLLTDAR
jgi:N-acyl-D-aspartate/D-glutamate deacylase